jgi:hypothetical protein
MKVHTRTKWMVDVGLCIAFLASFLLDLTGLELHQWIGVAASGLAAYHLVAHWTWVRTVTARFLGKVSNRARLYYAIDASILGGFAAIGLSGLVISSWLNLPLNRYDLWRTVHVWVSIATLVLTALKLVLHRRWLAATTRKVLSRRTPDAVPERQPVAAASPTRSQRLISRRDMVTMTGVASVGMLFALVGAANGLRDAAGSQDAEGTEPSSTEGSAQDSEGTSAAADGDDTDASSAQEADTGSNSWASQLWGSSGSSTAEDACRVRCNRGCSYPGHCRRYTDSNGNNLCDLGECL